MSSPRDVISRSLRQLGQLAAGGSLDANTVTDGLMAFNGVYMSLFGDVIGPLLKGATVSASSSLESGRLAQCVLSAAATLTFPTSPQNGDRVGVTDALGNFATYNLTINANGRKINGVAGSTVLNTNNTNKTWFFRLDTSNWVPEAELAIDDTIPLPADAVENLVPIVTLRILPEFTGSAPVEPMERLANQGRARLWMKYGVKGPGRVAGLVASLNQAAV